MKRIFFVSFLTVIALSVSAQKQPAGMEILQKVADKILNSPSMAAHFLLKQDAQKIEGDVVVSGKAFVISTVNNDYETWFDGKTMWTWLDISDEVSMTEPTPEELLEVNPFAIIANAAKTFNAYEIQGAGGSTLLRLNPIKTKDSPVKEVLLKIDTSNYLPVSMDAIMANNQSINFSFSDIVIGKKLDSKEFRYRPEYHPDAEIIDLR